MSQENLRGKQAIKKLTEIAESARICMMSTKLDDRPIPTRPMSLQEVDEDGRLWFISNKKSDKNYDVKQDGEVQLFFVNKGSSEYLSVYGQAEVYADQQTIDDKWSAVANVWFDGKDDPDLSVIGVKPESVRYWDTKHGKVVDMALMLYKAVSGDDSVDSGEKGNLNV